MTNLNPIADTNIKEWIDHPSKLSFYSMSNPKKVWKTLKKFHWKKLVSMNSTSLIIHSIYVDLQLGYHYIAAVKILKTITDDNGRLVEKILNKDSSFLVTCLDALLGKKSFYMKTPSFRQVFSYQDVNEYKKMNRNVCDLLPSLSVENVDYIDEKVLRHIPEPHCSNYDSTKSLFRLGAHGRFVVTNLFAVFFYCYNKLDFSNYAAKIVSNFHGTIIEWHGNVFKNSLEDYGEFFKNHENTTGKNFYKHIVSNISEKYTLSMYFPSKDLPHYSKYWFIRASLILHMMDLQNNQNRISAESLQLKVSPMNLEYLFLTRNYKSFRRCLYQTMAHLKKYKRVFPAICYVNFVMRVVSEVCIHSVKIEKDSTIYFNNLKFDQPFATRQEDNSTTSNKSESPDSLESLLNDFVEFVRYLKTCDAEFLKKFDECYSMYKVKVRNELKSQVVFYSGTEIKNEISFVSLKFVQDRLDKVVLNDNMFEIDAEKNNVKTKDETISQFENMISARKEVFVVNKPVKGKLVLDETGEDDFWNKMFDEEN